MREISFLLCGSALALLAACTAETARFDEARFNGQWVLESDSGPMHLDIAGAGTANLSGAIVGAVGGRTQPFLEAGIADGKLRFRVARQFDGGRIVGSRTAAWFDGDRLRGETTREDRDGVRAWVARRPDVLAEVDDGEWVSAKPIPLFDGGSVSEWGVPGNVTEDGWTVKAGVLRSAGNAEDFVSNRRFRDFRLQVEYRIAADSNSGIGLRGRYEVQILDDHGAEPSVHGNGAIYSRIRPIVVASRPPEEWQAFDIRLVGRVVTVALNSVTVIDRAVIPGITAIARDADEAEPGPIVLQGDHGPVEFRKIVVTPLTPL